MLLISVVLMGILFCWATTSVDEQSSDEKKNVSMMGINKDENVQYSDKRYYLFNFYFFIVFFLFDKLEMENTLIIFVSQTVNVTIVQHINVPIIRQIWVVQNGV
jgi:hypothetical protein